MTIPKRNLRPGVKFRRNTRQIWECLKEIQAQPIKMKSSGHSGQKPKSSAEKQPQLEKTAKVQEAETTKKPPPPPPPPPQQYPVKSEGKEAKAPQKDVRNGKKHEKPLRPAQEKLGKSDVKLPAAGSGSSGQAKASGHRVESKHTYPDIAPISPPDHPPPPDEAASKPAGPSSSAPVEGPTKPPPPPPPPAQPPHLADQKPAEDVLATPVAPAIDSKISADQTSPQAVFVPSTQDEDIHEFRKSDIVFENSDVMLIVRNDGKRERRADRLGPEDSPSEDEEGEPPHPSMDHLRQLYKDQKLCDLTIRIQDGPSFRMHRVALTARSPRYLDALRRQDRNQPAEIVLRDVSPAAVLAVIDHLYGHDVGLTEDNVEDVAGCAAQLGTRGLLRKCRGFLEDVSPDNVLNHLRLASKYEAIVPRTSRRRMVQVCVQNFGPLVGTEAFLKLTAEGLSLLLQTEEIHSLDEDVLLRSVALWLNHDLPRRKTSAAELLSHVRLDRSSPELINELIDESRELSQLPEVRKLLFEAYRHHALHPLRRASAQGLVA